MSMFSPWFNYSPRPWKFFKRMNSFSRALVNSKGLDEDVVNKQIASVLRVARFRYKIQNAAFLYSALSRRIRVFIQKYIKPRLTKAQQFGLRMVQAEKQTQQQEQEHALDRNRDSGGFVDRERSQGQGGLRGPGRHSQGKGSSGEVC